MYHGQFRIWMPDSHIWCDGRLLLPKEPDAIWKNQLTDEGEEEFLKMIFQDVSEIAGGANFYVGLCNQTPADTDVLTDVTSEPTVTNGYARSAIVRSAVGWPTITVVNTHKVIRSTTETFTASGGSFSAAFSRAFLTDQSSGTAGKLYGFTGAKTAAITLANGQSFSMQYEAYLN